MSKDKDSKNSYPVPPPFLQKTGITHVTDNLAENQIVNIDPKLILEFWPNFVTDFYRDKAEKEKNKK